MTEFKGEVRKIGVGQWSFCIKGQCGNEFCRGGRYTTKSEAQKEMTLLLKEIIRE